MRKTFLIAIAACCIGTSKVYGQIGEPRNDLAIGFNAGYTLNQVMFNPTIQQKFKGAPTFGFTARYTCEKYFKKLVLYPTGSQLYQFGMGGIDRNVRRHLQTGYQLYTNPVVSPHGLGIRTKGGFVLRRGRSASRLLFRRQRGHKGGLFNDSTLSLRPGQVNQQYDMPVKNKFEYGITAGAGLEVNTKIGHFLLEGRYYYGLSDIFGNGKKDVFGRSANGTIVVKASYLFDIVRTRRTSNKNKKGRKKCVKMK